MTFAPTMDRDAQANDGPSIVVIPEKSFYWKTAESPAALGRARPRRSNSPTNRSRAN